MIYLLSEKPVLIGVIKRLLKSNVYAFMATPYSLKPMSCIILVLSFCLNLKIPQYTQQTRN